MARQPSGRDHQPPRVARASASTSAMSDTIATLASPPAASSAACTSSGSAPVAPLDDALDARAELRVRAADVDHEVLVGLAEAHHRHGRDVLSTSFARCWPSAGSTRQALRDRRRPRSRDRRSAPAPSRGRDHGRGERPRPCRRVEGAHGVRSSSARAHRDHAVLRPTPTDSMPRSPPRSSSSAASRWVEEEAPLPATTAITWDGGAEKVVSHSAASS